MSAQWRPRLRALVGAGALLWLVGCSGTSGEGQVVTVEEGQPETVVAWQAFVQQSGSDTRACPGSTASQPPGCPSPGVRLQDLDLRTVDGSVEARSEYWYFDSLYFEAAVQTDGSLRVITADPGHVMAGPNPIECESAIAPNPEISTQLYRDLQATTPLGANISPRTGDLGILELWVQYPTDDAIAEACATTDRVPVILHPVTAVL